MRSFLENSMLIMHGVNPYPCALDHIDYSDFVILRCIMTEIRKKEAEDELRKWKTLMGG